MNAGAYVLASGGWADTTPMPSLDHEALVLLFRNEPALAPSLLRQALAVPLPAFRTARPLPTELGQLAPVEYRADLVIALEGGAAPAAVIVEVQLARDADKRFRWPAYVTNLRDRLRGPVYLLVYAPLPAVARWCARPIDLGPPGWRLVPPVLGPDRIPVVTEPERAQRAPELAVLSALAHGTGKQGLAIGQAALKAADGLDDERSRLYADLVMNALGPAARNALEKLMASGTYQYKSDFARKYFGQGVAKGKVEGKADDILAVLEARGLAAPSDARERIAACTDLAQLDRWVRRAATCASVDELFHD